MSTERRNPELIKSTVSIVDIVSRYVELKPNGPEFQACCPFHDEKTASFNVVPDKGFYHCFGCGAHGDVIDFVAEFTGVSFIEAVDSLTEGRLNGSVPVKRQSVRVDPYENYTPEVTNNRIGNVLDLVNPKRDGKVWHNAKPVSVHPYYNADKTLHGYVLRLEIDGTKQTPMVRWCNGAWTRYAFDEPRPMYGELIEGKQVIVVEGEKACDAVRKIVKNKISVVSWSGGTNAVDKTDWTPLQGLNVILWPDNDDCGRKAMAEIAEKIGGNFRTIEPPSDLPKGWDAADRNWKDSAELFSWCKAHIKKNPEPEPPEPEDDEMPPTPPPEEYDDVPAENMDDFPAPKQDDWRAQLMFKKEGEELQPNINNAQLLLAYHDDLAGVIAFNTFTKSIDILKRPPWESEPCEYPRQLTDIDDTRATAWLERKGCKLNIQNVHNAIVSAAHHFPFNPLQDYLNWLEWDGVERLDVAMHKFFGCEDNEYSRAVSRRFLVGAVARALSPGCKMDTMLILEGDQGLKKSTAVATLFGDDWFTDELGDLGSKDAALQVQGVWCVEFAELTQLSRSEASRIKEWITRRVDRFRPPYGRNLVSAPRQCVLVGTVNPEGGYLKDATGGRRFWPIKCQKINPKHIKQWRGQVWAEAVAAYKNKEKWWFDHEERAIAEGEQQARYESDAWTDAVIKFIGTRAIISVSEVMRDCLDLPSAQQNQLAQNRIAKILVNDGMERRQSRVNGKRAWVYKRD